MAVPTSAIKASDIGTEMGLLGSLSFGVFVTNHQPSGLNGTYYVAPLNSMLDFRGYVHTTMVAITSLAYSGASSSGACSSANNQTRYGDTAFLTTTTYLYADAAGTTYATSGYYEQSGFWKYWNSTTGTFTSSGFC